MQFPNVALLALAGGAFTASVLAAPLDAYGNPSAPANPAALGYGAPQQAQPVAGPAGAAPLGSPAALPYGQQQQAPQPHHRHPQQQQQAYGQASAASPYGAAAGGAAAPVPAAGFPAFNGQAPRQPTAVNHGPQAPVPGPGYGYRPQPLGAPGYPAANPAAAAPAAGAPAPVANRHGHRLSAQSFGAAPPAPYAAGPAGGAPLAPGHAAAPVAPAYPAVPGQAGRPAAFPPQQQQPKLAPPTGLGTATGVQPPMMRRSYIDFYAPDY